MQMLINGPIAPEERHRSDRSHLSNVDCTHALWATHSDGRCSSPTSAEQQHSAPGKVDGLPYIGMQGGQDRLHDVLTTYVHNHLGTERRDDTAFFLAMRALEMVDGRHTRSSFRRV